MWDQQDFVPIRGELLLSANTCYALELNIKTFVPEWNQNLTFFLEETVQLKEDGMQFILPRQSKIALLNN